MTFAKYVGKADIKITPISKENCDYFSFSYKRIISKKFLPKTVSTWVHEVVPLDKSDEYSGTLNRVSEIKAVKIAEDKNIIWKEVDVLNQYMLYALSEIDIIVDGLASTDDNLIYTIDWVAEDNILSEIYDRYRYIDTGEKGGNFMGMPVYLHLKQYGSSAATGKLEYLPPEARETFKDLWDEL